MNVVLIMSDQQKASSLPLYGNGIVRAPNLERLAASGCLFTRAFTSCPLCVPARVSTFTGQYPSAHGSLDNNELMFPGKRHLLRLLKEAGYVAGLAGKNHCFRDEEVALFDSVAECSHRGPDVSDEPYAAARRFIVETPDLKGCWTWAVNPNPPESLGTHWITDRAIEFVEAQRDRPFFLWYSIGDPHIPFQTAEPYASMYPPGDVDMPPQREGEMEGKPRAQRIDRHVMRGDDVDEERVRRIRSIYYGMNTYVDDEVGRFLSRLDELGLAEDTLVIYTSDHGEYLGEHRMIRKSKSAYDCLTHVPFILRGPGVPAGGSRGEFVGLEDVMPTVLRAAGLEVPAEVQGRDLGALLRGEDFADRGLAYVEYGGQTEPWPEGRPYDVCSAPDSSDWSPRLKVGGHGKMRAVRTEKWKLAVYVNDTPELYDLEKDPGELENVYGRPGTEEVTARLTALLLEQMMRTANPGEWPDGVN
ncbi:MAG: sulfatase-like hydrolase/transferase [Planctomycetota bacterium]